MVDSTKKYIHLILYLRKKDFFELKEITLLL